MVTRFLALVVIAVAAFGACGSEAPSSASPAVTEDPSEFDERAQELVNDMIGRRFGEVVQTLDPTLSTALTEENLAKAWDAFIEEHGNARRIAALAQENDAKGTLLTIQIDMERKDGQALVRFSPTGAIVGLEFEDAKDL